MEHYVLSPEDEATVALGESAKALLDSPAYISAIEAIRKQCAEAILTSAPDKRAAREDTYNLARGLSAVTAELLAIAALGQSTLDNATRPTTDQQNAEYLIEEDDGLFADY